MQSPIEEGRQQLMAALAARLTCVRGNMTDAEFGQLLADMVTVAERFGEIEAKPAAYNADKSPEDIRRALDIPPG